MKVKSSTLGLLLGALALGGVVLLVAQQPAPQPRDKTQLITEEEKPLFAFKAADIQKLTLQTRLHTLKFERDKSDKWQMLEPEKTAASDPSLAFLLDLVTSDKTPRSITAPLSDRQQFGLHQPTATLELTLKDQKTHRLVIGEYDFNRTHFYAQVDPAADAKDLQVVLISPNFDNAVNRPISEWKATEKTGQKASPEPQPGSPASPAEPSAAPEVPSLESPAAPSGDASEDASEPASPQAEP